MSENSVKPLSPDEVMKTLPKYLPDAVIKAVNNLLMKNYRGRSCTFKQNEIINEILSIDSNISREEIFDKKYLDFESIFRNNGWVVEYDKPGYRESYEAYFTFKKKK